MINKKLLIGLPIVGLPIITAISCSSNSHATVWMEIKLDWTKQPVAGVEGNLTSKFISGGNVSVDTIKNIEPTSTGVKIFVFKEAKKTEYNQNLVYYRIPGLTLNTDEVTGEIYYFIEKPSK